MQQRGAQRTVSRSRWEENGEALCRCSFIDSTILKHSQRRLRHPPEPSADFKCCMRPRRPRHSPDDLPVKGREPDRHASGGGRGKVAILAPTDARRSDRPCGWPRQYPRKDHDAAHDFAAKTSAARGLRQIQILSIRWRSSGYVPARRLNTRPIGEALPMRIGPALYCASRKGGATGVIRRGGTDPALSLAADGPRAQTPAKSCQRPPPISKTRIRRHSSMC